ncbi:MAG: bile acid:sodium symporter [Gemmataceae bacterium]|nr:bile acid:sodium symporter [Gemmataceae bacterium]
MCAFLARRWFLLVLVGGAALAVAYPHWFGWSAHLDPRLVVAGALFLMAWTLPTRSLTRAVRHPGPALWAVFVSSALLPAAAWLVGALLADDFRVGLLLSASVPCTLASAVLWTRRAGGDEAVALLVILCTTATGWLVAPAWLALTTGTGVALDTPAMMLDLVLCLVLPVGAGQLCQTAGPLARAAVRWKVPLGVVSQLLILTILLRAAANVGTRFGEGSAALSGGAVVVAALASLTVHLTALAGGLWGARALGFDARAQAAVAFASSQKTLPVALLLFERYFQAAYPLAILPLTFYHFGQLIVDTFIADALAPGGQSALDEPPPVAD